VKIEPIHKYWQLQVHNDMDPDTTSPTTQEVEKVWLKSYPEGIPAEIDVNEFSSVVEIFTGASLCGF
jgi:hypothetical protein